jgi:hypothetical protein
MNPGPQDSKARDALGSVPHRQDKKGLGHSAGHPSSGGAKPTYRSPGGQGMAGLHIRPSPHTLNSSSTAMLWSLTEAEAMIKTVVIVPLYWDLF